MKVWLLTIEYNAYEQYGEYFVAVFQDKPTGDDLCSNGITSEDTQEHILNGAGRRYPEDVWYNLREEEIQ